MVILIGNQKGGAGKSTLTLLLANYLAIDRHCMVTVIDMDYQQSLYQKFETTKVLENIEPYQVIPASLDEYPLIRDTIETSNDQVVLIDLPGKLDDDGLLPVFRAADLVICPFAYDEFSFRSTILFSVVLRKINDNAVIIYIPNRIKANVKYETLADVNEQLTKFGEVTLPVPDRIDFQRTSTFMTLPSILPVIRPVFEHIYQHYLIHLHHE
ncbi:ParA family protein [Mucilaginibacter limnophilus]|uniref:ParA family protein n=1 Tax=Mucilaginibacter limnophilus TaxID=1932778 RepID=A0A3S2V6P7_9SPHI|nr:ParA family protein [Mucilaginibacter limnophilus]RVT99726.1 ParA family protein [Mucilaginibacter limnophilus]